MFRSYSAGELIAIILAASVASCVSTVVLREAEAKKIGFEQCKANWVRGPYYPQNISLQKWKAEPDGAKWVVYTGASRKVCEFMVIVSADRNPAQCMKCINSPE